jgi:hypothetical protein
MEVGMVREEETRDGNLQRPELALTETLGW